MTSSLDQTRYEVLTHENENGDLILPIPLILLEKMGWREGDELDISVGEDGKVYMRKVTK